MLDAIRRFFQDRLVPVEMAGSAGPADPAAERDDATAIRLAACALLLELAYADDEFTDAERAHVEEALGRHFDLPPDDARALIALAEEERRGAVDLYQFTSLISRQYDEGQKMVLAEVMWWLVYADGQLAQHEAYLMRRISNLLELRPGYLAEARRRARADSAD